MRPKESGFAQKSASRDRGKNRKKEEESRRSATELGSVRRHGIFLIDDFAIKPAAAAAINAFLLWGKFVWGERKEARPPAQHAECFLFKRLIDN